LTDLNRKISDYSTDFRKNVKENFLKDVSAELDVSIAIIEKVLELSVNRISIGMKYFTNIDSIIEDEELEVTNVSSIFSNNMTESTAKSLFDLIENEVEFLRIKV
jgi:hypothetical protein